MLVPVPMVLFVAKVHQLPVSLYLHVAVMVCVSVSVHIMYSGGVVLTPIAPLYGSAPVCVGGLFIVSL